MVILRLLFFFFFNDPATTEIYTLSLHDALPICVLLPLGPYEVKATLEGFATQTVKGLDLGLGQTLTVETDRKSTRLNSSHSQISYAVFCLKKKKKIQRKTIVFDNSHQLKLVS